MKERADGCDRSISDEVRARLRRARETGDGRAIALLSRPDARVPSAEELEPPGDLVV